LFFEWCDFNLLVFHDFTWMITSWTKKVFPTIYIVFENFQKLFLPHLWEALIFWKLFKHDSQDFKTFEKVMIRLLNNIWICHQFRFRWILLMKILNLLWGVPHKFTNIVLNHLWKNWISLKVIPYLFKELFLLFIDIRCNCFNFKRMNFC